MRKMRLDRLIARGGVSRKEAAALIKRGAVAVDGQTITDSGYAPDLDACAVTLHGQSVRTDEHFHLMLHKPAGVITATEDGRGETVMDLLPAQWRSVGLGPVGRLDKDVTGLILLTTDGTLAHRLISPRWDMEKTYIATVEGVITDDDIRRAAQGIPLKDFTCKPAQLSLLKELPDGQCRCKLVISEGKYHQVKRMMAALNHPITQLHRASVGGIWLDERLSPGQWRELTAGEVHHLYAITQLED